MTKRLSGFFSGALLLLALAPVACGTVIDDGSGANGNDTDGTNDPDGAPPIGATDAGPKPPPAPSVTDLHLAEGKVDAAGATTVALAWTAIAEATAFRVERAPSVSGAPGTWKVLGTSPTATTQTFSDPDALDGPSFYRIVTLSAKGEGPSEPLAAYPVAKSSYAIPGQPLAGAPFNVELGAEVRYPKNTGTQKLPLVIMLHGNHAICRSTGRGEYCPAENGRSSGDISNACTDGGTTVANHLGYVYLLESMAARGYVAVSIDANALTCRNSSNAYVAQRAQLVHEHLKQWKTFVATGAPAPLGNALVGLVDLAKIGLMGHSRGGDAVALVPQLLTNDPIPGVDVESVLAVAPTDFADGKPSISNFSVLLPLCDGDVWDDRGLSAYDRIRNDPARTKIASQILFAGANHNFFNDTWTEDDNDATTTRSCDKAVMLEGGNASKSKAAQRGMLSLLMSDWYDATLRARPIAPFLRGEGGAPAYVSAWAGTKLDLRASYSGARHRLVDDFSAAGAPETGAAGGTNLFSAFDAALACSGATCDSSLGVCDGNTCNGQTGRCTSTGCNLPYQFFHEEALLQAVAISWQAKGARAAIDLGGVDASTYDALSFRVAAADSLLNVESAPLSFTVKVTDANDHSVSIPLAKLQTIPRLYRVRKPGDTNANVRPAKELLQTVRIPRSALGDLVPSRLSKLELVMDSSVSGAAFVTDVELTD